MHASRFPIRLEWKEVRSDREATGVEWKETIDAKNAVSSLESETLAWKGVQAGWDSALVVAVVVVVVVVVGQTTHQL